MSSATEQTSHGPENTAGASPTKFWMDRCFLEVIGFAVEFCADRIESGDGFRPYLDKPTPQEVLAAFYAKMEGR